MTEQTYPTDAEVSEAKHGAIARTLAAELSTATMSTWYPVFKYDTGFYLRREDGLAISLHSSFGGPGKWHASMAYNACVPNMNEYMPSTYASDQTGRTSINIAQSKTPKAIAGDLARRLVAVIEPAWATAQEDRKRTEDHNAGTRAVLARLADIIGAEDKVPAIDPERIRNFEGKLTAPEGWGGLKCQADLRVWDSGKQIDLELSGVPADIAHEIMRLIAGDK
jgi:hypothetical protein